MLVFLFLGMLWTVCTSLMYDSKPILRLGPEIEEPVQGPVQSTTAPQGLKEPEWVTMLRDDIKSAIEMKGYENAKDDIKDLIADANEEVNVKKTVTTPRQFRLRDVPGSAYLLRTISNDFEKSAGPIRTEHQWERDLKRYIKSLIGQYSKTHLDGYVAPVVKSIEENNNIAIKDIDVNPYGEITINWSPIQRKNQDQEKLVKIVDVATTFNVPPAKRPHFKPLKQDYRNEHVTMMPQDDD